MVPNTVTNISFSFDATPVIQGNGTYDATDLVVEIEGPGSVNVDDGKTKRSADISVRQTNQTYPWVWQSKTVVLYGITSETKVTLKPSAPNGTRRYYLDNLKFEKHSIAQ